MTIRISFSDKTVRVAVEINGAIESAITELPQRKWVGLTGEELETIEATTICLANESWLGNLTRNLEAKLKEKNHG